MQVFVFRAMRSARTLASAWNFAIVLRIRARAAALRLVLAIFLQSSRTLVDAAAYEQERTWETGSRPAATVDAESARGRLHAQQMFLIDTK
jgi:hypothetical protein